MTVDILTAALAVSAREVYRHEQGLPAGSRAGSSVPYGVNNCGNCGKR